MELNRKLITVILEIPIIIVPIAVYTYRCPRALPCP